VSFFFRFSLIFLGIKANVIFSIELDNRAQTVHSQLKNEGAATWATATSGNYWRHGGEVVTSSVSDSTANTASFLNP